MAISPTTQKITLHNTEQTSGSIVLDLLSEALPLAPFYRTVFI
jgi:hypothetical protein